MAGSERGGHRREEHEREESSEHGLNIFVVSD
jgi:hypothetical protein